MLQIAGIVHCNMSTKLFRGLRETYKFAVPKLRNATERKLQLVTAEIKLEVGARTNSGALRGPMRTFPSAHHSAPNIN